MAVQSLDTNIDEPTRVLLPSGQVRGCLVLDSAVMPSSAASISCAGRQCHQAELCDEDGSCSKALAGVQLQLQCSGRPRTGMQPHSEKGM